MLDDSNRSLVHFNARSLRKNSDNIYNFIDSLAHSFSIICISETWLCTYDVNLFGPSSYEAEYCHRCSDSYGGSAIFIAPDLSYTRRQDLSLGISHCESVWIELDNSFLNDNNNVILGCIYRSPSSNMRNFISRLDTILHQLSSEGKRVVLVGDININLLNTDNCACTEYNDCFSGYGFESLISSPTRCPISGAASLLDHAICNFSPSPSAGVIDVNITDHYPIFLAFNVMKPFDPPTRVTSVLDQELFFNAIIKTDWSSVTSLCNVDQAFNKFSSLFLKAVEECTKTVKCKKRYKYPKNPWLSERLLKSMRKKDNLYRKVKKKQPFNTALASRYKKYSNIFSCILKNANKNIVMTKYLVQKTTLKNNGNS